MDRLSNKRISDLAYDRFGDNQAFQCEGKLMAMEILHARKRLDLAEKLLLAVTQTELGGTPDLFWPSCPELAIHDWESFDDAANTWLEGRS